MDSEAFALKLKLRQPVLRKEREEVAQLVHRKLLLCGASRLILLLRVPTPSAITVARLSASRALTLSR